MPVVHDDTSRQSNDCCGETIDLQRGPDTSAQLYRENQWHSEVWIATQVIQRASSHCGYRRLAQHCHHDK